MKKLTEQETIRLSKLEKIQKLGFKPFLSNRKINITVPQTINAYKNYSKEELETQQISLKLAGRLMLRRGRFYVIRQNGENIQLWTGNITSTREQELIELLDLGDILWVEGIITKSNKNDLMLRVTQIDILAKALKPLPEKYKGLKNVEDKYRKRYLDLLFNPETREIFQKRARILAYIRAFFDSRGYLEVDTPVLQPHLGGASARPFRTFFNTLNRECVLRVATELHLKQLLVGDLNKVYEIGRIFRNEGVDTTHNPEFTSIEFYEAYSNLENVMLLTEDLLRGLVKELYPDETLTLETGEKIKLNAPFKRVSYLGAVSEKIGVEVESVSTQELIQIAQKYEIKIEKYFKRGHIIASLFEKLVEKTLISPTFVYGYPIEISPLARSSQENPQLTERAELFINGKELANMFGELNDPVDQLQRFKDQVAEKEAGNMEASEINWDFVEALEYAMPPAGGCGIGIDRLIMLLTNQKSIREVVLFPQLKEKK